jgi:hypothetical protein
MRPHPIRILQGRSIVTDLVTIVEAELVCAAKRAEAEDRKLSWRDIARAAITASQHTGLVGENERLRGWVEDAYLEGYSQGMCAGTLVSREEDWLASKARASLEEPCGEEK